MNDANLSTLKLDRVLFDRLADGELSDAEYRRVLAALEQQPHAWRTCAEAFLQAQAWQRDFTAVRAAAEVKPLEPAVTKPASQSAAGNWQQLLFVAAASFLFAFLAAQAFWTLQQPTGSKSNPPVVAAPAAPKHSHEENIAVPTTAGNQPLGKVQLAVNRLGQESPALMEVPVFDAAAARQIIEDTQPALSAEVMDALAAEGHQINREPQFISVPLEDGQQMMLPVETYRIVPVSRRSY